MKKILSVINDDILKKFRPKFSHFENSVDQVPINFDFYWRISKCRQNQMGGACFIFLDKGPEHGVFFEMKMIFSQKS